MDERNRTQDNLKFCFDLSTWKVVRPFSREEVGVYNFQKPGDNNCYSDWHIRKISQGPEPRELRRRLLEHGVFQSK